MEYGSTLFVIGTQQLVDLVGCLTCLCNVPQKAITGRIASLDSLDCIARLAPCSARCRPIDAFQMLQCSYLLLCDVFTSTL